MFFLGQINSLNAHAYDTFSLLIIQLYRISSQTINLPFCHDNLIVLWDKTIGGIGEDELTAIVTCSDGGFLLGATSNSNLSGDKTQNSKGSYDYWVIKIDSLLLPLSSVLFVLESNP